MIRYISRWNRNGRLISAVLFALILGGCASTQPTPSTAPLSTPSTDQLLQAARAAYDRGDQTSALDYYAQVIEKDNWHRKANFNAAVVHLDLAVRGFEFIAQFINDEKDRAAASESLRVLNEQAQKYMAIGRRYAVDAQ